MAGRIGSYFSQHAPGIIVTPLTCFALAATVGYRDKDGVPTEDLMPKIAGKLPIDAAIGIAGLGIALLTAGRGTSVLSDVATAISTGGFSTLMLSAGQSAGHKYWDSSKGTGGKAPPALNQKRSVSNTAAPQRTPEVRDAGGNFRPVRKWDHAA